MASQKGQQANKTAMAPAGANVQMTPVEQVVGQIGRMSNHFQQALPEDVPLDRFTRVVLTAIQQNPELATVEDKQSLYNSCVRAAQDGLLPNGVEGALVIFSKNIGTRDQPKYVKAVQWMPMVQGLIKRMATVGIRIEANIVYEEEHKQGKFKYELGDNPHIEHTPILFGERGKKIGAYMIATLPDGAKMRTFMRADEIEKVKDASKSKGGPWSSWEDEMWIKTVIRRGYKRLPIDDSTRWGSAVKTAVTAEDEMFEFNQTNNHTGAGNNAGGAPVATAARSESMQAAINSTKQGQQEKTGQTIEHPTQPEGGQAEQAGQQGQQAQGGAPTDILD